MTWYSSKKIFEDLKFCSILRDKVHEMDFYLNWIQLILIIIY